jgi:histone H3/H4
MLSQQVASEDVGAAVARQVSPGVDLAVMAMVCSGWWKGARALQTRHEYDLVWADHALQRELATLLRRLPDLEPELQSPELATSGGGGGGGNRYDEAMGRLARVCGTPETHRGRVIVRDSIDDIMNAAIQRMARRGGEAACSWAGIEEEARAVLAKFLRAIVDTAVVYTVHAGCVVITGMDVAHALQLYGRALPYASTASSGQFEARMLYLHAFNQLVREYLQNNRVLTMSEKRTTRVADVLLRRATEDFVAEVFATTRQSAANALASQVEVFRSAAQQCFDSVTSARHCIPHEPLPENLVGDDDEDDDGEPDVVACEQQMQQENEDAAYEESDDDTDDEQPIHLHDLEGWISESSAGWWKDANTASWWEKIDSSARCKAELHWEDLCGSFSAVPPRAWRLTAEANLAKAQLWWPGANVEQIGAHVRQAFEARAQRRRITGTGNCLAPGCPRGFCTCVPSE